MQQTVTVIGQLIALFSCDHNNTNKHQYYVTISYAIVIIGE